MEATNLAETITPGMLVFVKTTGEQGQVLAMNTEPLPEFYDKAGYSGQTALLKLPKASREHGIQMVAIMFAIEELETSKEKQQREYSEMFGVAEMSKGKAADLLQFVQPAENPPDEVN